ncbi:hypothetical protein Vafri_1398, partial [Volvox africanus]
TLYLCLRLYSYKEGDEDSVQNMSEKQFLLIAHRGNSNDVPENTIAAFDSAVDFGFPHFETDCQLTADGVVVILHDEQLGRTTPGLKGAVAEARWTDLQELDVGSWFDPDFSNERIPLLTEVLQRYWGRAHIHLVSEWILCISVPYPGRAPAPPSRPAGFLPSFLVLFPC